MYQLEVVRKGHVSEDSPQYCNPLDVFLEFRKMQELDRERFVVLHLDNKHRIVAEEIISIGTLSDSPAHPREVFKGAILHNSKAVIFLHNHTSGDPSPSRIDYEITSRLKRCGKLIGIEVLDHIIIGANRFYSFTYSEAERENRRRAA